MGSRDKAGPAVPIVLEAFEDHHQRFSHIARRTGRHSEIRDRRGIRADTVEHAEVFAVDCRRGDGEETIDSFP